MNQQIRELADEATKWVLANLDDAPMPSSLWNEKFAELIVQECSQVMKAEGEQFSLDQNFDAVKGVGRCMRRIREHFGVKE